VPPSIVEIIERRSLFGYSRDDDGRASDDEEKARADLHQS